MSPSEFNDFEDPEIVPLQKEGRKSQVSFQIAQATIDKDDYIREREEVDHEEITLEHKPRRSTHVYATEEVEDEARENDPFDKADDYYEESGNK